MNIISWNYRGIGHKGFVPLVKDIAKEYNASMIFFLEIHASGDKVRKFVKRIDFDGSFIIDSNGQAGGIVALWKSHLWKVDVLKQSEQFMHLSVGWGREAKWLLTVVYGKPQLQARRMLWDDLQEIHFDLNDAWAIVGDFNAILSANERVGGSQTPTLKGMIDFQGFVNDCDLIDTGYQGSPFTWKAGSLMQRLDRLVVNLQWRIRFDEAVVFHLPHYKSDHRPLLIKIKKVPNHNRKRRPLRFMVAWLTHTEFGRFLRNSWKPNLNWNERISFL